MDKRNIVLITDLRTAEAQDACSFLSSKGYEVVTVPDGLPLWNPEPLSAFAETVADRLLGVIHPAPPLFLSPLEQMTEEDFASARDDGVLSAWSVTRVFGGIFREKGDGVLIYLNSIHAEKPVGRGSLFSMGCGAVQMLAREVNQDYGPRGVRSFFIQRGITETDPDGRSDISPIYFGVDKRYPLRRMPNKGYLNELLAFLLTPAAAPLAGSDLRADGGLTMYYGERITEEQAQALRAERDRSESKEVVILGEE